MPETDAQENIFAEFLNSPSASQWKKIGIQKRSGVCAPLFSLYSSQSIGIGEIPDLKLLIEWCRKSGMSIVQLLPMNDVGFDFRPYDAQSTFALDSMYLRLSDLKDADLHSFQDELKELKSRFSAGGSRVNYAVKAAKLELLWKIFESSDLKDHDGFSRFRDTNKFWLRDYCFFKVIKEKFPDGSWEAWPEPYRNKDAAALTEITSESDRRMTFYAWLQWQLCEQFSEVKKEAARQGVYLMGDLPFLVSRDSSDVWSDQAYFKLDRVSGAPPDAYIAEGQRWGMPPYHWEKIAEKNYDYLREKVRYSENFYDMFRIDHFVGLFRLWSIDANEPPETQGRNGTFDPENEDVWEEHGVRILRVMLESSAMLPCGEDLGVVPDCSYKVLREYAIPGMDVQRWQRKWDEGGGFVEPGQYRKNAISVISTHDLPTALDWWKREVGAVSEGDAYAACESAGLDPAHVLPILFGDSAGGFRHWKKEVANAEAIPALVNAGADQCGPLTELYERSRRERTQVLAFAGIEKKDEVSDALVVRRLIERAHQSACVFSVQLITDWLALEGCFCEKPWEARINLPGTMSDANWSVIMPLSLEEICKMKANRVIKEINRTFDRI